MIKSCFVAFICLFAACDKSSFTVGGAKVAGPYAEKPASMDDAADPIMPDTPTFWVAFSSQTGKPGDVFATRLIAVDTGPLLPANSMVAETSITLPTDQPGTGAHGTFNFTAKPEGWAPGKYMVQLTHNNAIMATTTFPIVPKAP